MSAFGTKRTSNRRQAMSAFGGKADMRGYIAIRRLDTGFALAIYPG
jgi:hypothetical protein